MVKKCINSWEKYCPGYEIVMWDETNFDVTQNAYCYEAFLAQKWAFLSDYVRLWALVNQGGIYLDTDVEIIAPLDSLLLNKAFFGFEDPCHVSTAVMACEKNNALFRELLQSYEKRRFALSDGSYDTTTNVEWITHLLVAQGLILNGQKQKVCSAVIYPKTYFSPKDILSRKVSLTQDTFAVHHFDSSWCSDDERELVSARDQLPNFIKALPRVVGVAVALLVVSVKKRSLTPIKEAFLREKKRRKNKSSKKKED